MIYLQCLIHSNSIRSGRHSDANSRPSIHLASSLLPLFPPCALPSRVFSFHCSFLSSYPVFPSPLPIHDRFPFPLIPSPRVFLLFPSHPLLLYLRPSLLSPPLPSLPSFLLYPRLPPCSFPFPLLTLPPIPSLSPFFPSLSPPFPPYPSPSPLSPPLPLFPLPFPSFPTHPPTSSVSFTPLLHAL